tara:strand:+ start:1060 stop:1833 length:774 start_codon:yes stop_codon:yes gene_type:complete
MVSKFLIFRLFTLITGFAFLSGANSNIKLSLENKFDKNIQFNNSKSTLDNISNDKDYIIENIKDCSKNVVTKVCEFLDKAHGISPKVLSYAIHAHDIAKERNEVSSDKITIIDYSKPSTENRLWVLNLKSKEVEIITKVAHGSGSGGKVKASKFSNISNSHASSIGVAKTKDVYFGKHGKSLRLEGLETGLNDRMLARSVVIHGAKYVQKNGHVGRSWGCPAVSNDMVEPLVEEIKEGSLVFLYYPDKNWLNSSEYL